MSYGGVHKLQIFIREKYRDIFQCFYFFEMFCYFLLFLAEKILVFFPYKNLQLVYPPLWHGPFNENPYAKLRLGRSKAETRVIFCYFLLFFWIFPCIFALWKSTTCAPSLWHGPFTENPYAKLRLGATFWYFCYFLSNFPGDTFRGPDRGFGGPSGGTP